VPLGINYDRVLEDRTLLSSPEEKIGALRGTLGFVWRNVRLVLQSRWRRFGYACVNFGSPFSMREYCRTKGVDFQRLGGEDRKRAMLELGTALMESVGRVVPVVPVALMATVFIRHAERALSELELKAEAARLIAALEASGAHIYVPRGDRDYALTVGLRMLSLRNVIEERDGLYQILAGQRPLVEYYANSIAHLL